MEANDRHSLCLWAVLGSLVIGSASFLPAASTIDPVSKFAYSANAGWINFRHDQPTPPNGIVFGEYFLSGFAYGANFGWINFGDGSPADGIRYGNTMAADFGVNQDGLGNLSGWAYGANIGWINFSWAVVGDPNGPRVNLQTGAFSGFAYSANLGWINLGTGNLVTTSMGVVDTDGDGMDDPWEMSHFDNLNAANGTSDADGDGASDLNEYTSGTHPCDNGDYFRIISHTYDGSHTRATVVFTTDPSRLYRLEICDNLCTWCDSGLGVFAPDAGLSTIKEISWDRASRKFIRAVALRPLP